MPGMLIVDDDFRLRKLMLTYAQTENYRCREAENGEQALQRVDVLRKEVITNVSHELRSPLALIGGCAEMVRDITWKDDTQREENLNLIISEANRMSVMVSDILDYSQLQSGCLQLNRGTYDLCEIVEHEVRHCEQSAQENHLSLSFEDPGEELDVQVDALKISQVVRNLLNNAINHTKDGETIAQYFIGQSYLAPLSTRPVPVFNVTFEPGCRNNWHIHHASRGGGQMLICVSGRGWYQEWGHGARELHPGDVVNIPAGVKHWHGAAQDSWFQHLAVEVPGEDTHTEWCEPVDGEQYSRIG